MENVGLTPAVRRLLQDLLKEGGNECNGATDGDADATTTEEHSGSSINGSAASSGVPASGAGQLRKVAARGATQTSLLKPLCPLP
ncbi:uncharacterized protein [Dermacentor albipictus]|uniref:uncharacterized protein isoform X2 n=1 Tax=Dermacentor albipictus TaxID=60249 RepID=UPI0031FD6B31